MKVEIIELPIKDIKPYWRNSRRGNVQAVKRSIEEFGYRDLIIVDANNVIIVGHTRYKALTELGYETVEAIVIRDLDADKIKQYRIADNRTSDLATWDDEALTEELKTIKELATMQHFFTPQELEYMINKSVGKLDFGVSLDQVQKAQEKADELMHDRFEQRRVKFTEITCPSCGHKFNTST